MLTPNSQEELQETLQEIRDNSKAVTDWEKKQEDVIVAQLSDPTFANIQVRSADTRL